jgi:arginase family enzyme
MPHVASLTQLGIRTRNQLQVAFGDQHRGRLHQQTASQLASEPPRLEHIEPGAPVYLTVDADGIDPAFAPGVSHPVPGGVSPRFVLDLIQSASWRLVGMDVVEVNPSRDINDLTSIVAGRLVHEGMGYARRYPAGRDSHRR